MINARLIINGEEVDVYDFEAIELTDVIQDVSDIGEIFTEFTQQFSLPASKKNNRIFKHYYNSSILNGFDARFKADAIIQVGGADFKKGKIRLNNVAMESGKPSSYNVVFLGNTVKFSEILGSDELSSLSYLSKWNHERLKGLIESGFKVGLGLDSSNNDEVIESTDRDIVYPLISSKNHLFYDNSTDSNGNYISTLGTAIEDSRNLYSPSPLSSRPDMGISYEDLKPAIRIKHILDAIEDKYVGIEFDRTFFDRDLFNELYMSLHTQTGVIKNVDSDGIEYVVDIESEDALSNSIVVDTYNKEGFIYKEESDEYIKSVRIEWTITPSSASSGMYDVEFIDATRGVLKSYYNNSVTGGASETFVLELETDPAKEEVDTYDLTFRIKTKGNTFTFFNNQFEYETTESILQDDGSGEILEVSITGETFSSTTFQKSFIFELVVTDQIPKMKTIDFLTSIFKMFNLTAYFDRDTNKVMCIPLEEYYAEGNNIDITKYINTDSHKVLRNKIYSEMEFNYSKTSLFANSKRNDIVRDEVFGNLTFDDLSRLQDSELGDNTFDGGKYSISVKFEKMLFERMTNQSDPSDLTPIQWGWFADKKESPLLTAPLLFYNINTDIDKNSYRVAFSGATNLIESYNRPSNSLVDGSYTINFNAEIDEFTGLTNTSSLFENYYKDYVQMIFRKNARIYEYEAHLPLKVILKYSLKDTFQINNIRYRINKLKYNLLTGKASLELINI